MASKSNQYQPGQAVSNETLTGQAAPLRPTPEPAFNPGRDPSQLTPIGGLDPDEAVVHQQLHSFYHAHIGAQPRGLATPQRAQIKTAIKAAGLGCLECASYTAGVRHGLAEAARRADA